ncbi:melanoma-associated antigen B4-like [Manis javanica]|uniref:melanoma-associated antigen B4-like n=1 Tax=Manis javanica TaxID=9974 RepID=UPI000812DDB7|nr:melanoma-associated antigen B4-like [Manis javanica]KAI5939378.1 Melanoma-associated antigen B4 [Manis javanica]
MPYRYKSKKHQREKCHKGQGHPRGPEGAREAVAAAEVLEPPSSSSSMESSLSSSAVSTRMALTLETEPHAAMGTSDPGDPEDAASQDEQGTGSFQAIPPEPNAHRDLLSRKVNMMMESLLEKFKTKDSITQAALIKIIGMKYSHYFPELLRRTSRRMELVFGLELKEVNHKRHVYTLVSTGLAGDENLSSDKGLSTSGFLMSLLGVIFMKGNRATKKEVWEFLNTLGVYAGRRHPIIGEPCRLINKELVQQKYLEYHQVPGSDPPCYEFLWGDRAHAETSKMRVLEFLAKIYDTVPSSFPSLYNQALRDEQERKGFRAASAAKAPEPSGATSHSSSNI